MERKVGEVKGSGWGESKREIGTRDTNRKERLEIRGETASSKGTSEKKEQMKT